MLLPYADHSGSQRLHNLLSSRRAKNGFLGALTKESTMIRISTLCVLLAFVAAATMPNVAHASEVKVSVPHVYVPHITTSKVRTPPPPPVNNSATITVKRANTLQHKNARWHDWQEQITNAQNELKQLEGQLNAANIRAQRAQQESNNGRQQVENAKAQVNAAQKELNSLAPESTQYAETQLQLKNAQQQLNNAEQQLRNAEAQLNAAQTQENTLQAAANAAQTLLEHVPYK